ncbi:MAG TPA: multicopper oxidase domain-containing protein [Candidatus Acidoferrales bacterium]|nr:multicopper oxidase domain-containing protein [Candidatus Acidoferrales bacterium]
MSAGLLRRSFLQLMGSACLPFLPGAAMEGLAGASKPDATLHISPVEIEIAPRKLIKTTGYNGSAPGPFLRFREGQQVTVDVVNDTKEPELVHWHGMFLPSELDGSAEEGTPLIPPSRTQRYSFVARPSGTRWYHTHVSAGRNLKRATYTGQFGMVYIEPTTDPGQYDAEYSLCLHGWEPYLSATGGEGSLEAIYQSFSVNDRALGHSEPIRVRQGQRVLFRILNASATLQHQIALAGHQFTVISLDGNPVPVPRTVGVLSLGPAERADAIVTMDAPGVWIMGEVDDTIRNKGLGIVVEYENRNEVPQWVTPPSASWDYTVFGSSGQTSGPVEVVPLVFRRKFAGNNWVDHWTINDKEYPKTEPLLVRNNAKYRLRFDNQSDEDHPVHLHRHTFELTRFAGKNTAGVLKDVVVVPRRNTVEVDFLANHPGLTLFHCHQQLHMDFGFMTLLRYVD